MIITDSAGNSTPATPVNGTNLRKRGAERDSNLGQEQGHDEQEARITGRKNARNCDDEKMQSLVRPSLPVHKRSTESPLSSDAIFRQSHAGLFNLCIVVLIAVNSRLIIENLMKYGLLIRQTSLPISSRSLRDWPLLMCGISLQVFPIAAFLIEKLKARWRDRAPDSLIWCLHFLNLLLALLYPMFIIHRFQSDALPGLLLVLITITGWLKLISYAHTNADIRSVLRAGSKIDPPVEAPKIDYPDNITLRDIAYFMLAPTLCYQPSYPRSPRIRKAWVLRQLGKLIAFSGLLGFIIGQYMNPIMWNSAHPLLARHNRLHAMERILKLSIPTLYVWLGFFYCFFHLWLNILAELLRFGDREFYKDWWNARTVGEYWRLWNMPVHRWMLRHVYFPCLRLGMGKRASILLVFVVSGVFHELLIAVPCGVLRGWAFLGIMLQVPLVLLTNFVHSRTRSSMAGNMLFWFLFCIVGQPACVLLYYQDLVKRRGGAASQQS